MVRAACLRPCPWVRWPALALALSACVTAPERTLRSDLARAEQTLAQLPTSEPSQAAEAAAAHESLDDQPGSYVAYALLHDARLRASWERWRAATHRIARERRLPMPVLTYSLFVAAIETRVGPQRHRLAARQRLPWPGELRAGSEAAAAAATAEQRRFEAERLELRARVLAAYWQLWLVREVRRQQAEQLELLAGLAELARVRLEVGRAGLVDVQRIELERARLADDVEATGEAEIQASARLLAELGAPPDTPTPTQRQAPRLRQPDEDRAALRIALVAHPTLDRWRQHEREARQRVREARHARAPAAVVGVDWIEIGPARAAQVEGSGRDAVALSLGLELPLWQRSYAEDQRAAEADEAAARASFVAGRDRALAELEVALSQLRDTGRRVELHERSLLPQAEGMLEALLGRYAAGEAELAAVLLAERELLELRIELAGARARHAVAWAELERTVGRPIAERSGAADGSGGLRLDAPAKAGAAPDPRARVDDGTEGQAAASPVPSRATAPTSTPSTPGPGEASAVDGGGGREP